MYKHYNRLVDHIVTRYQYKVCTFRS